jgi:hypothetical protein
MAELRIHGPSRTQLTSLQNSHNAQYSTPFFISSMGKQKNRRAKQNAKKARANNKLQVPIELIENILLKYVSGSGNTEEDQTNYRTDLINFSRISRSWCLASYVSHFLILQSKDLV